MLGYRGNSSWRDMSEYVVHFCGTREVLLRVLTDGYVEGQSPFGWARDFELERQDALRRNEPLHGYPTQKSVCLSEVPLDLLDRLVDRHGVWGLGFTKKAVVEDGGAPVWYVEMDSHLAYALARMQNSLTQEQRADWYALTRFIDKVGEFPNGSTYRFEWEREWRVPKRLELGAGCPVFLFAPQAEHPWLKAQVSGIAAVVPLTSPLPILDPTWDEETLQAALVTSNLGDYRPSA